MANEKQTALPEKFVADTYYAIQLRHSVQYFGRTLPPGRKHTMLGAVAEGFRDSIASAKVVDDGVRDEEA